VVRLIAGLTLAISLAACANSPLPTAPSQVALAPVTKVVLEAEAGSGDGQVRERSRASGGQTVHLGPGENRRWTFKNSAPTTPFAVAVTYANGQEGENEEIDVTLDGRLLRSFRNRDSGDAVEGWNLFVTDPVGASTVATGAHTLVLGVRGGDGCVEIDLIALSPER
jgi:hypothetical protein